MSPEARGGRALRVERIFRAPAPVVFDAWLSVEVLERWWPPGPGWETPVAEVDARVGGALRLVMRDPAGQLVGGRGTYVELSPPRRLAFTWMWDADEGDAQQLVEVDFHDRGDGTTSVVLTNHGLPDEASRRGHRDGWQASFDNLDGVLVA